MRMFYDQQGSTLHCGDCLTVMAGMEPNSIGTIITDPPYGYEFMGKEWDRGIPGVPFWKAALRVAKPGAFLLAFGGTRTFHRLTCAIEDAGWEIRDCMSWLYGSGFPKSLDISKAIDKRGGVSIGWFGPWLREERGRRGITQKDLAKHFLSKSGGLTGCVANWELGLNMPTPEQFNTLCGVLNLSFQRIEEAEREVVGHGTSGKTAIWSDGDMGNFPITAPATSAARQWDGWGTALKPAWEPIIVAMKPLDGTFAENAQRHGVAGLNIDGARIPTEAGADLNGGRVSSTADGWNRPWKSNEEAIAAAKERGAANVAKAETLGRWPANVVLDETAAALLDQQTGELTSGKCPDGFSGEYKANVYGKFARNEIRPETVYADTGGASRFFYTAKASKSDRGGGNNHPTVKPTELMKYLCRLTATPTGGVILDPFAGSGTTLVAAREVGRPCIGIELDEAHCRIIVKRLAQGHLFGAASA